MGSYETDIRTPTIVNSPDIATTTTLSGTRSQYDDANNTRKINETGGGGTAPFTDLHQGLQDEFYEKICKTTCEQNCDNREPQGSAMCYCDWACIHLGDCCLDYEAACLSGPNVTVKNYADILRNRTSPSANCYIIIEETRTNELRNRSLLVVTSCGRTFPTDRKSSLIDLCERLPVGNKTLASELLIMFRDVIYRNRYCAICNNPDEQLTDIITVSAAIYCENVTEFAYMQRYHGDTGEDIDISNCDIRLNLSNFDNQHNHTSRYRCMMDGTAIDTCDANRSVPVLDFDYLQVTCHKYHAYISHIGPGTTYSNPHCAMCNGVADINGTECGMYVPQVSHSSTPPPIAGLSFVRIINFDERFRITITCIGDSVFDHTTGDCVTPTCPAGHVMLRDKGCTALDVNFPQIFSAAGDIRIYFVIVSEYQFSRDVYQKIISDTGIGIVGDSFKVDTCDSFTVWDNWDAIMSINSFCCIQETLSRNLNEVVFRVQLLKTHIGYSLPFYNVSGITMCVFNQDVSDISRRRTCLRGSPKIRHDLVFLGDKFSPHTFPSTFLVMSTSQEYNVTEVPILVSWTSSKLTDSGWNKSNNALVCEPDIMSCDTVTFQADEYTAMGGSIVIYEATPQEVTIPERNVLHLDSNAIVFCSSLLSNMTGVLYSNNADSFVEWILSVIGSALSMVCLILTITTYCMFEQIRTRAGKCVMNLCVALFFAQLSFHISDTFVPYHEACAAIAAFQHYFWLVAFLWMNVLAFDISCTFADLKPSNVATDTNRLRFFAVYAWGFPAVFIAVCLVLDHTSNLPFCYGSSTMCWITGHRAVVYYFATPLAVVITANAMLFVRTVVGLRRALSIASKARQPRQQRNTFVIYVRLTSLMGFTWLFGFLANIDVLSFLSYPFILCNTCQGVFVGVSFALTPTVQRHWRDWFKAKQNKNTSDISIVSPSATSVFEKCDTRL